MTCPFHYGSAGEAPLFWGRWAQQHSSILHALIFHYKAKAINSIGVQSGAENVPREGCIVARFSERSDPKWLSYRSLYNLPLPSRVTTLARPQNGRRIHAWQTHRAPASYEGLVKSQSHNSRQLSGSKPERGPSRRPGTAQRISRYPKALPASLSVPSVVSHSTSRRATRNSEEGDYNKLVISILYLLKPKGHC